MPSKMFVGLYLKMILMMLELNLCLAPEQQLLEAMTVYRCQEQPLGEGGAGVVLLGSVPSDYRKYVLPIDESWIPGSTQIAVKVPKDGEVVDINQLSILHEAQVSARIAKLDPEGLFLRYYRDIERNLLLSNYLHDFLPLDRWIRRHPQGLPVSAVSQVASQLKAGLGILRTAALVHSDICWENVLINPVSGKIIVLDYGISANVGQFTPGRERLEAYRRAGRFKSPNQRDNLPAQFGDDAYAVQRMIANLRRKVKNPSS